MKIALIPIDNRPVCYNLIKEIASIDDKLEILLPDRTLLGGLKKIADINAILEWFKSINNIDAVIVSLDTIAYGGLISSRRNKDSFEEIKQRLNLFKKLCNKNTKIYAFSSIMRISNNNINEEEKEYWNKYGTQIFEYSYNFHREGLDESEVPKEILHDYLATRYRNFNINKMYLDWLEEGFFNTLVFSKDDCAQYGFNVLESQILQKLIKEKNLDGTIKTGADEIPLTLLARTIVDLNKTAPKISYKFLVPEYKYLISNYEDISIEECVKSQLELAKCNITSEKSSDINLIINNFEEHQGEMVMGVKTKGFSDKFKLPEKPFMIADVRYTNGADNNFVKQLIKKNLSSSFYGYSGWNTSANSLGSLICIAIVRFFAQNYNKEAFKQLLLIRFLDDWAYQANVRQTLKRKNENRPDVRKLKKLMTPFEEQLKKVLKIEFQIKYKFPWKRFFEVEIIIK